MTLKFEVKKCRFCDQDRVHPEGRYITDVDIPVCEYHLPKLSLDTPAREISSDQMKDFQRLFARQFGDF